MVSTFFKNPVLQEFYNRNYFLKIKLIDEFTIKKLRALYEQNIHEIRHEFFASNYLHNPKVNEYISRNIIDLLEPILNEHLINFRLVIGLFYTKPPGKKSGFHIHRDWSLVDENKYSSLHLWLPLCDVNEYNGNIFFFEEEKIKLRYRGSPNFEFPRETIFEKLRLMNKKKNHYFKEGEALFFDHKLRHGSNINHSNENRIAVGISILPKEAKMIHYHKISKNKIILYEVSDDFYLHFNLSKPHFDERVSKKVREIEI